LSSHLLNNYNNVKRNAQTVTSIINFAGVKVIINEADITDIQAEISGPAGTPYENGIYRCKLAVEGDFPESAPKGKI
jgi:ubiquitin-protein ligase